MKAFKHLIQSLERSEGLTNVSCGDNVVMIDQIIKGLMCNAKEFELYPVTLLDIWNERELLKLPPVESIYFFCWAYSPGTIVNKNRNYNLK